MSGKREARAAVLAGLGAWVPPHVVTNHELARSLHTSDEWIQQRTGIRMRHIVEPGMTTSDLAFEAGRRALESAGTDQVDAVVVATVTPDRRLPATAPEVARRLDLVGVPAFDIASACSGFVYGLASCAGLIVAGTADQVLLIAADAFSTTLNPTDKTTVPLFGDGAGAVVLRAGAPDELGSIGPFDLGSDGRGADLATIRGGGAQERLALQPFSEADHYFTMQGLPLAQQAVLRMVQSTQAVLGKIGWRVEQVDHLVCHQANLRILLEAAYALGLPTERCVSNIDRVGNTVAASIPLVLADVASEGTLQLGDRVVIAAFGAGLAWGATALRWPDVKVVNGHR